MTGIQARVIEKTRMIGYNGGTKTLTTFQLRYWRAVHGEVMTHRVFTRNGMSSRAVPTQKFIDQVLNEPAGPIYWGKNQSGMQAAEELTGDALMAVQDTWKQAADSAAQFAGDLAALGAHKQIVNRVLEPFQWMNLVLTATDWDNWEELRDHADAQPEIRALAQAIINADAVSLAVERKANRLHESGWHLPYVTHAERRRYEHEPVFLAKLSTARNARVSYLTTDGANPVIEKDIGLFDRLVGSRPLHASPCEHVAYVTPSAFTASKNFSGGFRQFRELVEHSIYNNQPLKD